MNTKKHVGNDPIETKYPLNQRRRICAKSMALSPIRECTHAHCSILRETTFCIRLTYLPSRAHPWSQTVVPLYGALPALYSCQGKMCLFAPTVMPKDSSIDQSGFRYVINDGFHLLVPLYHSLWWHAGECAICGFEHLVKSHASDCSVSAVHEEC